LASYLQDRAVGHRIESVVFTAISALKTVTIAPTELFGGQISAVARHGKFLDISVMPVAGEDPSGVEPRRPLHLVIHLARAGWLRYREQLPGLVPRRGKGPLAMQLRCSDGSGFELTEAGTKKGLAVYIVHEAAEVSGVARLGPDALAVSPADFATRIRSHRAQLKGVLTDQRIICGMGNAYSDEVLHTAKLSPFAMGARLNDSQLQQLYAAMRDVLEDALLRSVGMQAAELKKEKHSGLRVHGRTDLPCPVCQDTIREVSFADSSLQYCPGCQTGGKLLADRRLSRLLK